MKLTRYTLLLDRLELEARIGIHPFEREKPQQIAITIELEIDVGLFPTSNSIAATFDYDWIRDGIHKLIASRHYDLQETLARDIVDLLGTRREIARTVVATRKPDVYPDAASIGCRLEAHRV